MASSLAKKGNKIDDKHSPETVAFLKVVYEMMKEKDQLMAAVQKM